MFGSEDDDAPGLADISAMASVEAGEFKTTDRDCDFCESSEGSVTVRRDTDEARCKECYNDPETYDE